MEHGNFETDRLLAWLEELVRKAEGVDVVVTDAGDTASSSVQITLHRVPGPLAGLPLRRLARE